MRWPPAPNQLDGRLYRPPGNRSAITGVCTEAGSKSSIVHGTPASRAIASRCNHRIGRTSSSGDHACGVLDAVRSRMSSGLRCSRKQSITNSPQRNAACALAGCVAGMSLSPSATNPMPASPGHRVGGELATARHPRPDTRLFRRPRVLHRRFACAVRANSLEHLLDGDRMIVVRAVRDAAAV